MTRGHADSTRLPTMKQTISLPLKSSCRASQQTHCKGHTHHTPGPGHEQTANCEHARPLTFSSCLPSIQHTRQLIPWHVEHTALADIVMAPGFTQREPPQPCGLLQKVASHLNGLANHIGVSGATCGVCVCMCVDPECCWGSQATHKQRTSGQVCFVCMCVCVCMHTFVRSPPGIA